MTPSLQQLLDTILAYQKAGNSLDADYKITARPIMGPDSTFLAPDNVSISKDGDKPVILMEWN